MKTKYFHFSDGVGVIRICSKRIPSSRTIPKSDSWVVEELTPKMEWQMPCFPEIGWMTLKKMKYLGFVPTSKE